jgi:hypothetical protein
MALKLPIYAIVGARPVKAIPTAEGGMDVLVLDWDSGDFKRDMRYALCLVAGEDEEEDISGMDVKILSEEEFEARVEEIRKRLNSGR